MTLFEVPQWMIARIRAPQMITLWANKNELPTANALFDEFIHDQETKWIRLSSIESALRDDLGLSCSTFGRTRTEPTTDLHIVFLDLFLGRPDDDDAVSQRYNA